MQRRHSRIFTGPVKSAVFTMALLFTNNHLAYAEPDDAPEDDILQVIDLPLAAQLANETGVPEQDVQDTLKVANDGGMSAGVLSEVMVAEADAVKMRGKKKGLPEWVMERWSAGVRGVDLKKGIGARPDHSALAPSEKQALHKKLREQHKQRLQELKAQRKAIKAQRKAGKALKLRGKAAHDRLEKRKGHHAAKGIDKKTMPAHSNANKAAKDSIPQPGSPRPNQRPAHAKHPKESKKAQGAAGNKHNPPGKSARPSVGKSNRPSKENRGKKNKRHGKSAGKGRGKQH